MSRKQREETPRETQIFVGNEPLDPKIHDLREEDAEAMLNTADYYLSICIAEKQQGRQLYFPDKEETVN